MAAPYSNLDDKLARAVAAYLISVGLGNVNNIVSFLSNQPREMPGDGLVTIHCGDGVEEWLGTGNYRFPVTVELKFPAITPAEASATQQRDQEIAARQRQAAINDKLLLSDDEHTLAYTSAQITAAGRALAVSDGTTEGAAAALANADMVNFTCIWWQAGGFSMPAQQPDNFVSEARFEAIACAANID